MKKIYEWLVYSSANPENISRFLKSLSFFVVFYLTSKGIDQGQASNVVMSVIDGLIGVITAIGTFVSALTSCYYLFRKVHNTITGSTK